MHIMYLIFWENALESYLVNKYLLNGYSCSRTLRRHCGKHPRRKYLAFAHWEYTVLWKQDFLHEII